MHRFTRLLYPLFFGIVFALAGFVIEREAVYLRSVVFIFAGLYWGLIPGLLATSLFLVPALLSPSIEPIKILAILGTLPAVPCVWRAERITARGRLFNAVLLIVYSGLLASEYWLFLQRQPKMVSLPLAMALFCFLYYFFKNPNIRAVMRAGLLALLVNYAFICIYPVLAGGFGGPTRGDVVWTAEFLSQVMAADILVVLIIAYVLPMFRDMFGTTRQGPVP